MTIYPIKEPIIKADGGRTEPPTIVQGKWAEMPDADWLFTALLADPAEMKPPAANLEERLKETGLIANEDDSIQLYKLSPDQIARWAQMMAGFNQELFNKAMTAFGDLRARSVTTLGHHPEGDKTNYDVWQEFKEELRKLPLVREKLTNYLKTFATTARLIGYRDRLFGIFKPATFEGALSASLAHLNHLVREFHSIACGYTYAGEILVDVFPDEASKLLADLLKEAEEGNWNEGDGRIRARMLLITILAGDLFGYRHRQDVIFQTILLQSPRGSIRAASATALISAVMEDHRGGLNVEGIFQGMKGALSDEEFRLSVAACIGELLVMGQRGPDLIRAHGLYTKLTENWTGDKALIDKVVGILGGRLPFNRAMVIQDNFLSVLGDQSIRQVGDDFSIWQGAFLNKVNYRETFINRGSEDCVNNYVHTTDIELTRALVSTFIRLSPDGQYDALAEWIKAIQPMWALTAHPLSVKVDYNRHFNCAVRMYWVSFIIKLLLNNELLSGRAQELARQFIVDHAAELVMIDDFLDQKDFIHIKDLHRIKITKPTGK